MADLRSSPARSEGARKRAVLLAFAVAVLAGLWFLLRWSGPEPERASTAPGATARVAGSASASDIAATESSTKTSDVRQSIASDHALQWNIRVLDATTREPVSGARARLTARDGEIEGASDANGSLALETEDRPEADLAVDHPAYVKAHFAALRAHEPHDVLLARAGEIRGRFEPATSAPATILLFEQVSEIEGNWPVQRNSSDAHGAFHFGQLAPGDYTLAANIEGYTTPTLHSLRVRSGEAREVVMSLTPEAVLHGRLLSLGAQLPIEGARVSISESNNAKLSIGVTPPEPAITRSNGRFEFRGLLPATYALVFRPREGMSFRRSLSVVEDGETIDQDFLTPPTTHFHGRAIDLERKPVADATMILVSEPEIQEVYAKGTQNLKSDGRPSARSGADGTFEIDAALDPGKTAYLYSRGPESAASGLGFDSSNAMGPRESTHDDLGDILILGVRTIHGVVKDDRGFASHATVELNRGRTPRILGTAISGDDGSFSIAVPEYQKDMNKLTQLSARSTGAVSDSVLIDKAITAPIELVLKPVRSVTGRVLDIEGRAVPNIPVVLGTQLADHHRGPRLGGGDAVEHTDANGRFRFAEVRCMESEITLDHNVLNDWLMESRDPVTIAEDGDRTVTMVVRHVIADERASIRGRLLMPKGLESLNNLKIQVVPQKADSSEADMFLTAGGKKRGILERHGDAFTIDNVSPGRVVIVIDSRECLGIQRLLELRPGEAIDVGDIELVRAAQIHLKLRDAGDRPVLEAKIELSPVEGGGAALTAQTYGDGDYFIGRALCGRSYDLRVHRAGRDDHVQRIEVPAESSVTLTVRVEA